MELDFHDKIVGPPGPYIFRFSCQQKYFSEKHEKVVASEKESVTLATQVVVTSSSDT